MTVISEYDYFKLDYIKFSVLKKKTIFSFKVLNLVSCKAF